MKTIEFSKHALLKLEMLQNHGVLLDMESVKNVVSYPQKVVEGYRGRRIAQGKLDPDHVLRVVYEERVDEIVIITFGRKERYD